MKTKRLFAPFVLGLGLILGLALLLGAFSGTAQADVDRDVSAIHPVAATGAGDQVPIFQTLNVSLTELFINGPTSGMVGVAYAFTATVSPPSATLPIVYDWRPEPTGGSGTVLLPTTNVATYTWRTTGPQTITLTASNGFSALTRTHTITLRPVKVFLPLITRGWPPPTWHVQQVDARRMFEDVTHRSVALDSQGRPHVAIGYQELYHAWHDGNGWQFEVVDAGPWVGRWASIDLDSANRPHISYYDWENTCLKYARWDGATWQIESPDCEGLVGWDTHILLDDDDHPHISYTKAAGLSQQDLRYAHWDGAQWTVETIEAGSDSRVGGDNSLALDTAGHPHVSYNDSGSGSDPYCLKHAVRVTTTWQIETVEDGGFVGSNSLAIDNADHVHIVYQRSDMDEHLKHAYWDGATWSVETVITHTGSLDGLSLVLDNGQQPHFSYYHTTDAGLRDVRYVHWDGATWQIETADMALEGTNWMEQTSLVLDSSGAPHIVFYLQDSVLLRYAHKSGTTWQAEDIDKGGVVGVYSSLALDSADRPRIAYYEEEGEDLLYAAWDGAQWQVTMVDTEASSSADGSVSLALDSAGRPHISYRDATDALALDPHGLKYAHWDGATWQTEYVDQEGKAGRGSAIVVDNAGLPHISYYDLPFLGTGEDSVRYATWNGVAWDVQTVDLVRQKYVDSPTSLALDSAGRPHIAYLDGENEDLRYARWDGSTWQTTTVDSSDDVGVYPSLALDSGGLPHISYRDRTNDDLKYAHWDGALWQTETVTDTGDVGYYSSLVLDGADRPHITYYDETSGGLRYAHWTGTTWEIDPLVTGEQAYYTSLALDRAGLPHVAYQNHSRGDLEYAWLGP